MCPARIIARVFDDLVTVFRIAGRKRYRILEMYLSGEKHTCRNKMGIYTSTV